MQKWLSIIGIGEDGLSGLSPAGRSLLDNAALIGGGDRHLAMLPATDLRPKLPWSSPIEASLTQLLLHRGSPVCVLASGDPMCYGIGVTLTRRLPLAEITIVPAASAFSLACSRLGWPLAEVDTLSLCGRSPALLNAVLYAGARLLLLSADQSTPALVAQNLVQQGFGASQMTLLERLGGPHERLISGQAASWAVPPGADLNTLAVEVYADQPGQRQLPPRLPGLPDSAYRHDGQLTKQAVRAVTLAALAPLPGQRLWDVGAGCGSIGIEWMRSDRRCRAIAIEPHPTRLQYIADNAIALGTPALQIVAGRAPASLQGLPAPDAVFIGGGLTTADLVETCWQALRPGGRLVANAVTVEGEQVLFEQQRRLGGELSRLAVQRAEPVGKFLGWKALAPITQWLGFKPPSS